MPPYHKYSFLFLIQAWNKYKGMETQITVKFKQIEIPGDK